MKSVFSKRCRRRNRNSKSEGVFFRKEGDGSFFSAAEGKTAGYVNSLNGKGQSLPSRINQFFSSRMGHDFSNVKVHTGKDAANSAKDINARAYTNGNNIVFNEGQYNMETGAGKKLMAHELAHVVQQGKSGQQNNIHRSTSFSDSTVNDINISEKYVEAVKAGNTSSHVGITVASLNGHDLTNPGSIPLAVPSEKDITTVPKGSDYESTVAAIPANSMKCEKHVPKKPSGNVWSHTTTADDFSKIIGKKCSSKQVSVYVTGKPDSKTIVSTVDTHESAHVSQLKTAFNNHVVAFDTNLANLKVVGKSEKLSKYKLMGIIKGNARVLFGNLVTDFNDAAVKFHGTAAGSNASFSAVKVDSSCMWIKSNVTI